MAITKLVSSSLGASALFSDDKIVNDLSTLALRQASDQNKSAYNTNSSFVDVFQDATGVTNLTNTSRSDSEYVSSVVQSSTTLYETTDLDSTKISGISPSSFTASLFFDGNTGAKAMHIASPSGYSKGFSYDISTDADFPSNFYIKKISWHQFNTNARMKNYVVELYYDSTWNRMDITPEDSSSQTSSTVLTAANTQTWNTAVITNPVENANVRVLFDGFYNNGNTNAGISEMRLSGYTLTANATGSFENNAITAPSSVSSMGAIITYQDNAGTNALNTDIVLQLSADGGSNYSTATLTAMPDFASGIKMAKVNDLAVTAGTQLKYKISFANQAQGSKEARIRGVSLNY